MNDRQRYAVGIAAAVLVHLFAAVMLGLFGVKYMEVPFRGEISVSYTHLTLPTIA